MTDIPLIDAMVLWAPNSGPMAEPAPHRAPAGSVVVIDHPGRGRHRDHPMSGGACDMGWKKMSENVRLGNLMFLFHTLTVRDRLDVDKVHDAFLVIPEYRKSISPEIKGSENRPNF